MIVYALQCRLQKEESLIFRVTKTNEVSGVEKVFFCATSLWLSHLSSANHHSILLAKWLCQRVKQGFNLHSYWQKKKHPIISQWNKRKTLTSNTIFIKALAKEKNIAGYPSCSNIHIFFSILSPCTWFYASAICLIDA